MKRKIKIMIGILITFFGLIIVIFSIILFPPTKYSEAEKIVTKLGMFQNDHQKYPKNLEELKPDYLKNIYSDFAYSSDSDKSYWMQYEKNDIFGFKYTYVWTCNPIDGCYTDFGD